MKKKKIKRLKKTARINYQVMDEVTNYLINELYEHDKELITKYKNPAKNIIKSIKYLTQISRKGKKKHG